MGTIRVRFILVALVVSFFAVGMSAFLNYFKYKSTIGNIVKSRVLVVGRGIESSIQASLQLGLQFTELSALHPGHAGAEKSSDRLVRGIDVFDASGQVIYSTDRGRVGTKVPESWNAAAERSKTTEWAAEGHRRLRGRHLAQELVRPHRGLPRAALFARRGGARGHQCADARSCSLRSPPSLASRSWRRSPS